MKVRFKQTLCGSYGVAKIGDELELSEGLAKQLIKAGHVEEIELHTITEQDLELNPDLVGQVEVGEVVELGPIVSPEEAEKIAEEVKEEAVESVEDKAEEVKEEAKEEESAKEKVDLSKPTVKVKKEKKDNAGPSK